MTHKKDKYKCKWLTCDSYCHMNTCMLKLAMMNYLYDLELTPNYSGFIEVADMFDVHCELCDSCGFSYLDKRNCAADCIDKIELDSQKHAAQKFESMTIDDRLELFNDLKTKKLKTIEDRIVRIKDEYKTIKNLKISN